MATKQRAQEPRAVIHKQILNSAETQPDASMAELAAEVAGASPELVERVLEEYGDPGVDELPHPEPDGATLMDENVTPPTAADLTQKQRETLQAIAERPDATQSELADRLDVSRATVNKRVNDIDGFEWRNRRAFVEAVLAPTETPPAAASPAGAGMPETGSGEEAAWDGGQLRSSDAEQAVEELQERVARLEQQRGASDGDAGSVFGDKTLTAKVVRAVVADDEISDEDELRVLEALL